MFVEENYVYARGSLSSTLSLCTWNKNDTIVKLNDIAAAENISHGHVHNERFLEQVK